MARDAIEIRRFDGVSTVMSKEDKPAEVLTELVNLRPAQTFGRAVKRDGYSAAISSGLTSLQTMIEFTDKGDTSRLVISDSNAIEESVNTAGSYGALAAPSNDERSSATISGADCNPEVINKELRIPTGTSYEPVWLGYIPARDRYNSAVTLTAGRYLDYQYDLITASDAEWFLKTGIFDTAADCQVSTAGLDKTKKYAIYTAPVYDEYQRGFPVLAGTVNPNLLSLTTTPCCLRLAATSFTTFHSAMKRLTAIDVFIAEADQDDPTDITTVPAYFLERIDLNDDGREFLSVAANVGVTTANKVVIDNYADWMTFDPRGLFIRVGSTYYRVTAYALDTPGAGEVELTVTPNAAATGDTTVYFLSRWYLDGTTYYYYFLYDNFYRKLGSEMYEYLNIPYGDAGLGTGFKYKYVAYNGVRALYGGFSDANFTYFSKADNPDVVPALNVVRHRHDVKGLASVGKDFLVFSDRNVERVTIYDNTQAEQDDEFLDVGLVSHRAIAKINENAIAVMTYKGPVLIQNRRVANIGEHLRTWWLDTFSQTQMEACVAGYNHLTNEIWFSFPTYTDATYTAGIIFVFDFDAYQNDYISPWWICKTDTAIKAFALNSQLHLLGGGATKVVDFNASSPSETVDSKYRLKMVQNFLPNKKVWFDRLFVDCETSDTVTATAYYDGSASGVAVSLNTDLQGFMRYIAKTLEVEVSTAASANSVEHKGLVLTFTPKRV